MKPRDMDSKRVLAILEGGLALVEKGWTQGEMAKDKASHRALDPSDPKAARWCAVGAVLRARSDLDRPINQDPRWTPAQVNAMFMLNQCATEMFGTDAMGANDLVKKKDEVINLFTKTIRFVRDGVQPNA